MNEKFTPAKDAHWYKTDGTPAFEVPKKSGKGMKKPNINDARELGLLPSVTTVLKSIDKPFLVAWFKNQVLDAAIQCSVENDAVLDNSFRGEIMDRADEASAAARERGLDLHKRVEAMMHGYYDPYRERDVTVQKVSQILDKIAFTVSMSEQSFASVKYGYAGRLDLGGMASNPICGGRRFAILDVKTQDTKGKGKFNIYPEMPAQLAAYAYGIKKPTADLYSLMVSSTEEGVAELWHHPDNDLWFYAFNDCLRLWRGPLVKGYDSAGLGKPERAI